MILSLSCGKLLRIDLEDKHEYQITRENLIIIIIIIIIINIEGKQEGFLKRRLLYDRLCLCLDISKGKP